MGHLVIHDVDDGLIDQLNRYAVLHQSSLEEMLRKIIASAISGRIVKTPDGDDVSHSGKKRIPPPQFKGRVRESGDVLTSVPQSDWELSP